VLDRNLGEGAGEDGGSLIVFTAAGGEEEVESGALDLFGLS